MTQRQQPADRTADLLRVALRVAATKGWSNLTRDAIARAADVSPALVSARLGTMDQTRRSVMRAAVRDGCVPVVAEGLARRDPHALKASETLKAKAAAWVGQ